MKHLFRRAEHFSVSYLMKSAINNLDSFILCNTNMIQTVQHHPIIAAQKEQLLNNFPALEDISRAATCLFWKQNINSNRKWFHSLGVTDWRRLSAANVWLRHLCKHSERNLLIKRQTAVLPLTEASAAEQQAATRHAVDSHLFSSGRTRSLALTIFITVALSTYTWSREPNPTSLSLFSEWTAFLEM